MPLGIQPIDTAFPGYEARKTFDAILHAVPWARDTSHAYDEHPSISVDGATIWVADDCDDADGDVGLNCSNCIVIEFFQKSRADYFAVLHTCDLQFALRMIYAHALSIVGRRARLTEFELLP